MMPKCRRTRPVVFGIKGAIHAKTVRRTKKLRNWTAQPVVITQVSINTFLQHNYCINLCFVGIVYFLKQFKAWVRNVK